jgi:hypothetical protein
MKCGRFARITLSALAGMALLWPGPASAQLLLFGNKNNEQAQRMQAAALVPLDSLPPAYRDKVSQVVGKPTVYTKGAQETFEAQPELYRWLLDNPDRAVVAWKRLGAKCVDIQRRGPNQFGWSDTQGSEVVWTAIHTGPNLHVWFAEGQVKPGVLFPMVPVQCVAMIRHGIVKQDEDGATIQHQADVFAYSDSKTAAVVTRMLGPSVPRLAKQGVGQLQMFFGALAWYCHEHPDRADKLLRPDPKPVKRSDTSFDPTGMILPQGFQMQAPLPRD